MIITIETGIRSSNMLNTFKAEFEVSSEKILEIAGFFRKAMEDGLKGSASPLKMLPSYIGKPSGNENGVFYTVDFGGTNVRCTKFKLENGKNVKLAEIKNKLKDPDGKYDLTSAATTGEMLFSFIADVLAKLADADEKGYLGHTFSFPSRQMGINDAELIEWTKEIKVSGVVDRNPNKLLGEALERKNINIHPIAIINDTVGTLLVAGYMYEAADVGTIMGTGHNTCYLEGNHPLNGGEMIVNMESGNFNIGLPLSKYDRQLDANSAAPGTQLLEKMVSGYYIGEIVRLIIADFHAGNSLFQQAKAAGEKLINGKVDSLMVENFILYPEKTVKELGCTAEDAAILKELCEAVVRRAARLAAASFIGTILHMDKGEVTKEHVIAVDGTIYEKMPGVPELIDEALRDALKDKAQRISVKLVKDGSGLGAAIAAAVAGQQAG
jgi:hexokinase